MKKLERLEKNVAETRAQWQRAYNYAYEVSKEAYKRRDFICFRAPVRKRYERAVKDLERAKHEIEIPRAVRKITKGGKAKRTPAATARGQALRAVLRKTQ